MTQIALKLIIILSMMLIVRSTEDITGGELIDTMEMPDREVKIVVSGRQPAGKSDEGDAPIIGPEMSDRITLQGQLTIFLISCLNWNKESRPVGMQVLRDPLTSDLLEVKLNMSKIFRTMTLRFIITGDHSMGMLYISGNAAEDDFHRMLLLEDLEDAMGLAVIPGYRMIGKNHVSSLWDLLKFLNLALDNVWSLSLHPDNQHCLWDNIFRLIIGVCSGKPVELPDNHQSTCSCYRMVQRILAVCDWIKLHPGEEANMANAVDTGECSTGHLCPVLFRLLPILGIKSLYVEKDVNVYDGSLGHVLDANIEKLSINEESGWTDGPLLDTFIQANDNGQCAWKYLRVLKAPGWIISASNFIALANNLKQLESVESVVVLFVFGKDGRAEDLFCNPRANRLLSKCIFSLRENPACLDQNQTLCDAIRRAKIEHLSMRFRPFKNIFGDDFNIWTSLRTFDCGHSAGCIDLDFVRNIISHNPSLEKIECSCLRIYNCDELMGLLAGRKPGNLKLSAEKLFISYTDHVISESLLELFWKTLTDELSVLKIHGTAVESLPAPKLVPAFANKLRKLNLYDFSCISTDMCSHLGKIGEGVRVSKISTLKFATDRDVGARLAALLGTAGRMTPFGRSVISLVLRCEVSESFNLEPFLNCDKLSELKLMLRRPENGQMSDEVIARVAAEIGKFKGNKNGLKLSLDMLDFIAEEPAKLLHQICLGSDPAEIIKYIHIFGYNFTGSEEELKKELDRYRSVEKCQTPVDSWGSATYLPNSWDLDDSTHSSDSMDSFELECVHELEPVTYTWGQQQLA